jgi:hypothetical protein
MLRETSNSPGISERPHNLTDSKPRGACSRRWNGTCGRNGVLRTVACFALMCLVGCVSMGHNPGRADLTPWPEIRPDFRMEALRLRMHEYSITFAAEVDLAATAIERQAGDSTVRRNALLWRVRAIPEMRKACFRLEPVGALVDAWIFALQMERLFSGSGGAAAFGRFQPEAIEVSHRLVGELREIGGSIAVSPDARDTFERRIIEPWIVEHPLRDLTFVRESPIARLAEQSRTGGDMFQSVGTMEELAVSLSQQARIYLADLPRQVRGEVDLMRADMLTSEDMASLQNDVHVSAAAADRLASTSESITPLLLSERRIILEALSLERELAIGALTRAFAIERGELLKNFMDQRLATLDWATLERREAIADVRKEVAVSIDALRGERAVVVAELRSVVDTVLMRVAVFFIAAVLLAPLVAHAYARVWPRRWRDVGGQRPAEPTPERVRI